MIRLTSLMAVAWLTISLGAVAPAAAGPVLQVYSNPAPLQYSHHNDDFTVRVRQPGGSWRDLYEYDVKVDLDKPQDASLVRFDFEGRVEVSIEKNNGDFRRVQVRPA